MIKQSVKKRTKGWWCKGGNKKKLKKMEKRKKWEDVYKFLEARWDDYVVATFLQYAGDVCKRIKNSKNE